MHPFPMNPSDHHLTKLIILCYHHEVSSWRETLTQLHTWYCVVKQRQVVKRILSTCTLCKRVEGPLYGTPSVPPLPNFWLSNDFTFTRIGVDYARPLYVKDICNGKRNAQIVYCIRFLDASYIAFVWSLKRFISGTVTPFLVISDNGKTFKRAELKNFITSSGDMWWGFYEWIVISLKRCPKKVLANARLTYEELLTVLIQIKEVFNSWPLTYLYLDGETPLTLSQLVLGRRLLWRPSGLAEETSTTNSNDEGQVIIKQEKYLRTILLHFWKRCQGEYHL